MKKFIYFGIVLLSSTLIVLACKKVVETNDNSLNSGLVQEKSYITNPFSDVGKMHNELLDFINESSGSEKSIETYESMYNSSVEYLNNKYHYNITTSFSNFEPQFKNLANYTLESKALELKNQKLISQIQYDYLARLFTLMNTDIPEQDLYKSLDKFEIDLNQDNNINEADKSLIYKASSTARSSYQYWSSAKGNAFLTNGLINKAKCPKPGCIAAWDITGVVVGAIGSVGNPGVAVLLGAFASVYARCCICCYGSCAFVGC